MFFLAVALWMQAQAGQPSDTSTDQAQDSVASADTSIPDPAIVRQVKVQVSTVPETVTVGQHFTVTVHAHLPADLAASLTFPDNPDPDEQDSVTSAATVLRKDTPQGGLVDATATYVLSAWYTGKVGLGLGDLVIAGTHIHMPAESVMVRSLLPADSVKRANSLPKEPRGPIVLWRWIIRRIFHNPKEYVQVWAIFSALILLIVIGAVFWWRSRSRKEDVIEPKGDWAEREFQRIEAMRLLEKGESEQYAILMSTVARQFLIRTFATVRASATTRELASALRGEPLIPADRVLALFERVDLLKFARAGIQGNEAQGAGTESRAIVREVVARHQAAVVALEEERARSAGKDTMAGRKKAA